MNKQEFLNLYIRQPEKIRIIFEVKNFLENSTIKITNEIISLEDALSYYVPKFKKNGQLDKQSIELQIKDPLVLPLKLQEVYLNPQSWDLGKTQELYTDINQLEPIPIATHQTSGKTLILDSNHTVSNILNSLDEKSMNNKKLNIVRIIGENLEDIICDFRILNRQ